MHLTNFMGRSGMKTAAEKLRTPRLIDAAVGTAITGLVALAASAVAQGHSWKNVVPLVFTVVLLTIAGFFGVRAGILSTVAATLIFAACLFGPTGSLAVTSDSARSNLGWMLLIGIAFSFLFAPSTSGLRRH